MYLSVYIGVLEVYGCVRGFLYLSVGGCVSDTFVYVWVLLSVFECVWGCFRYVWVCVGYFECI